MNSHKCKLFGAWALTVLLILIFTSHGQVQGQGSQPNVQAVSQTGLLPLYGVDFNFDEEWVDSAQFPSRSPYYPNFGVNVAFQRVWDALKPAGFNVLRFPVSMLDATATANRVANLCVWAKNNKVKVVPILAGAEKSQLNGVYFASNVSTFIRGLVANLRSGRGQYLEAYNQILAFQLEHTMNHIGLHEGMSPQSGQLRLLQAASAVRNIESEDLKKIGLYSTPLIINASFDYELIKVQAMAGVPLSNDAYAKAYEALKMFLAELAASADIDLIDVEWFPGSVSAGGVDRFPNLLGSLMQDFPDKQIIFTTGFSAGFNPAEEQNRFYASAFTNLADFRARGGLYSPFVGLFFHEALNGKEPNPEPPNPKLFKEMVQWDRVAKAGELVQMWSGSMRSYTMAWWSKRVRNNMGLLARKVDESGTFVVTAQPAQEVLNQIASIVSEASATIAVPSNVSASPPVGSPAPPSAGTAPAVVSPAPTVNVVILPPGGSPVPPPGAGTWPPVGGFVPPSGTVALPPNSSYMPPSATGTWPPYNEPGPPYSENTRPPDDSSMPPSSAGTWPPGYGSMPPYGEGTQPPYDSGSTTAANAGPTFEGEVKEKMKYLTLGLVDKVAERVGTALLNKDGRGYVDDGSGGGDYYGGDGYGYDNYGGGGTGGGYGNYGRGGSPGLDRLIDGVAGKLGDAITNRRRRDRGGDSGAGRGAGAMDSGSAGMDAGGSDSMGGAPGGMGPPMMSFMKAFVAPKPAPQPAPTIGGGSGGQDIGRRMMEKESQLSEQQMKTRRSGHSTGSQAPVRSVVPQEFAIGLFKAFLAPTPNTAPRR